MDKKYVFIAIALLCVIGYCNKDNSSSQKEGSNEYNPNNDLQEAVNNLVTIYRHDENSVKEVTNEEAQKIFKIRIEEVLFTYKDMSASRVADKIVYGWETTRNRSNYDGSLYDFFDGFTRAIRSNKEAGLTRESDFNETLAFYTSLIVEGNQ